MGSLATVTEPSADRGPRRGSPAGVVDAPDARSYFRKTDTCGLARLLHPALPRSVL
jgi:hypothetical protein